MSNRVDRVYYCRDCGNEIKFLRDGGGQVVCCGHPMEIKKEGFNPEE